MNTRIALVSFFSIVSLALGGCSGADEPDPVGSPLSTGAGAGGSEAPKSGEQAGDEGAPGERAAEPGEEGVPAGGKPATPADKQPAEADPACVASCNTGLKAKCAGDDQFCADVCSFMTAQELSCLSSAPSCDKPEWIRCMPEPADDGGGNGGGQ
jgi:hypothetical protein